MIEPVRWRLRAGDKPPFEREGRHLRITVYCPNDGAADDDRIALRIVRELAHLECLRIADTDPNAPWQISIESDTDRGGFGAVKLTGPQGCWADCAMHVRPWPIEAAHLLGAASKDEPAVQQFLPHVPMVEGHRQAHRDVLITTVPELLGLRPRLPDANIRTPAEGLKFIGLYLRSIGNFTVRSWDSGSDVFGRGLFYFVLCRERLPAMWRYCHACVLHARSSRDNAEYLASSILHRCVRAIQARDEVGFRFYQQQNNSTRDEMLYHFDYLTLMLSGAIDVQARVAHRLYNMANLPIRFASFKGERFRTALKKNGAIRLVQVIDDPRFQAFHRLLGALRNSVHGAGLHGSGLLRDGQPESSIIRVLEDAKVVWDSSSVLGLQEALGVSKLAGVAFEPYACARTLTHLGLSFVDAIAASTEIEKWLPSGITAADLRTGPPDDRIFSPEVRERIGAMG